MYFIEEREKEQSETLSHCITVKSSCVFLKEGMAGWSNFSLLFSILYVVQDATRKRVKLPCCVPRCEGAEYAVAFL